jgi:hypothetical protein
VFSLARKHAQAFHQKKLHSYQPMGVINVIRIISRMYPLCKAVQSVFYFFLEENSRFPFECSQGSNHGKTFCPLFYSCVFTHDKALNDFACHSGGGQPNCSFERMLKPISGPAQFAHLFVRPKRNAEKNVFLLNVLAQVCHNKTTYYRRFHVKKFVLAIQIQLLFPIVMPTGTEQPAAIFCEIRLMITNANTPLIIPKKEEKVET